MQPKTPAPTGVVGAGARGRVDFPSMPLRTDDEKEVTQPSGEEITRLIGGSVPAVRAGALNAGGRTAVDANERLASFWAVTKEKERGQVKRLGLIAVLATMLVGFSASAALGVTNFANAPSGAHYAQGSAEPVCTLTGLTVSCTGTTIGGVGNTNATVNLTVTSTFTGTCTNPGGHLVEPFTRQETTTTTSVVTSTRNGQLIVPAQTATAVSSAEFLASFKCPNPNWTPAVTGTAISYVYKLTFAGFTEPAITVTG